MTTYQDPPLQSRRSVRQSERDKSQTAVATPASAEPLTYSTQGSSAPVPDYDAPSSRARRTPQPVSQADLNASAPGPVASRPRDFSPEGRATTQAWTPQYGGPGGAAGSAPAGGVADGTAAGGASADGTVEYQTQQRGTGGSAASVDSNSAYANSAYAHEPAAIIPSALDSEDIGEHTLSRRELRALREAHGIRSMADEPDPTRASEQPGPAQSAAAKPAPAQPAPDAVAGAAGTPFAAPSSRLDSALAEFDQLAANRPAPVQSSPPPARGRRAAPVSPVSVVTNPAPRAAAVPPAGPTQIAPEALQSPLVSPPAAAAPQPIPEIVVAEIVPEPVIEASIVESVVVEPAIVEPPIVELRPVDPRAAETAMVEPPTSTPPTGHWSTQAQLDDETQVNDSPVSRNIGNTSGAITTSALVLPSIPSYAFGSNDESMTTGSISLSELFTATGAHPSQLDESDLDHLLDPGDHQVASTDSQPVRAIKAVSTHTSSRGVIQTVKPKGTRGLTALIIAATGMAVVVGALFIVLVATGQL